MPCDVFFFVHPPEFSVSFLHLLFLQLPHATLSCVECVSVALLFEQVLRSFFGCDVASLLPRSPSLTDFVRIYRQQSPARQTRYIVSSRSSLLFSHRLCSRDSWFSLEKCWNRNFSISKSFHLFKFKSKKLTASGYDELYFEFFRSWKKRNFWETPMLTSSRLSSACRSWWDDSALCLICPAYFCWRVWLMKEGRKSFVTDDLLLECKIFHNVVWRK